MSEYTHVSETDLPKLLALLQAESMLEDSVIGVDYSRKVFVAGEMFYDVKVARVGSADG